MIGDDLEMQMRRLAVAGGHFPVRWMPDANYGYGYPFYHYYAPLSIYIAALFRFLGFSFVRAIQLAQVAGFVLAGWGMARLAGRWLQTHQLKPAAIRIDIVAVLFDHNTPPRVDHVRGAA